MVNLLEETKEMLERHSKTFDDILFVGDEATHTKMTVKEFLKHANVEYNGGYGIEEINTKLILVGKDFWLERHEYDGSEWWEYKEIPNLSALPIKKVDRIIRDADHYWADSISELNKD